MVIVRYNPSNLDDNFSYLDVSIIETIFFPQNLTNTVKLLFKNIEVVAQGRNLSKVDVWV